MACAFDIEAWAFHHPREVTVALDSHDVGRLQLTTTRRGHPLNDLVLSLGAHTLTFRVTAPPDRPADLGLGDDRRLLSIAIGRWHWTTSTGGT
jgi:hypothetical protein